MNKYTDNNLPPIDKFSMPEKDKLQEIKDDQGLENQKISQEGQKIITTKEAANDPENDQIFREMKLSPVMGQNLPIVEKVEKIKKSSLTLGKNKTFLTKSPNWAKSAMDKRNLFAAIHGSSIISGTSLEGGHFKDTLNFFTSYVKNQKILKGSAAEKLKECFTEEIIGNYLEIEKLIAKAQAEDLPELKNLLKSSAEEANIQKQKDFQIACQSISERIKKLEPGKRLLIPGGFRGEPGHAMLILVEACENGKNRLTIFNTGARVGEYHPSQDLAHQLFLTVEGASLDELANKSMWQCVLEAQIIPVWSDNKEKRDDHAIYLPILRTLQCNSEAKLVVNTGENAVPRLPQIAGNCFWEVIYPLLSYQLGTKASGKIELEIKIQTLAAYFQANKDTLENNETHRRLLKAGVRSAAKCLMENWDAENPTKSNVSFSDVISITALLEEIESAIGKSAKRPPAEDIKMAKPVIEKTDILQEDFAYLTLLRAKLTDDRMEKSRSDMEFSAPTGLESLPDIPKNLTVEELPLFFDNLEKILPGLLNGPQDLKTIAYMESVMRALPIPESPSAADIYSHMSLDEKKKAQIILGDLQMTYLKTLQLQTNASSTLVSDRLLLPYQALTIIDKLGRSIAASENQNGIDGYALNRETFSEIFNDKFLIYDRTIQESFLKISHYMQATEKKDTGKVLCQYNTGDAICLNTPGGELEELMTGEGKKAFQERVEKLCENERLTVREEEKRISKKDIEKGLIACALGKKDHYFPGHVAAIRKASALADAFLLVGTKVDPAKFLERSCEIFEDQKTREFTLNRIYSKLIRFPMTDLGLAVQFESEPFNSFDVQSKCIQKLLETDFSNEESMLLNIRGKSGLNLAAVAEAFPLISDIKHLCSLGIKENKEIRLNNLLLFFSQHSELFKNPSFQLLFEKTLFASTTLAQELSNEPEVMDVLLRLLQAGLNVHFFSGHTINLEATLFLLRTAASIQQGTSKSEYAIEIGEILSLLDKKMGTEQAGSVQTDRGLILQTAIFCRLQAPSLEADEIREILSSQVVRNFFKLREEQVKPALETQIQNRLLYHAAAFEKFIDSNRNWSFLDAALIKALPSVEVELKKGKWEIQFPEIMKAGLIKINLITGEIVAPFGIACQTPAAWVEQYGKLKVTKSTNGENLLDSHEQYIKLLEGRILNAERSMCTSEYQTYHIHDKKLGELKIVGNNKCINSVQKKIGNKWYSYVPVNHLTTLDLKHGQFSDLSYLAQPKVENNEPPPVRVFSKPPSDPVERREYFRLRLEKQRAKEEVLQKQKESRHFPDCEESARKFRGLLENEHQGLWICTDESVGDKPLTIFHFSKSPMSFLEMDKGAIKVPEALDALVYDWEKQEPIVSISLDKEKAVTFTPICLRAGNYGRVVDLSVGGQVQVKRISNKQKSGEILASAQTREKLLGKPAIDVLSVCGEDRIQIWIDEEDPEKIAGIEIQGLFFGSPSTPLRFHLDAKSEHLLWSGDPSYRLVGHTGKPPIPSLGSFFVLEDKHGQKKIILPRAPLEGTKKTVQRGGVEVGDLHIPVCKTEVLPKNRHACEVFTLLPEGGLEADSAKSYAYLAYAQLAKKNYLEANRALDKLCDFQRVDGIMGEELEWFLANSTDESPESLALQLRFLAVYLLHEKPFIDTEKKGENLLQTQEKSADKNAWETKMEDYLVKRTFGTTYIDLSHEEMLAIRNYLGLSVKNKFLEPSEKPSLQYHLPDFNPIGAGEINLQGFEKKLQDGNAGRALYNNIALDYYYGKESKEDIVLSKPKENKEFYRTFFKLIYEAQARQELETLHAKLYATSWINVMDKNSELEQVSRLILLYIAGKGKFVDKKLVVGSIEIPDRFEVGYGDAGKSKQVMESLWEAIKNDKLWLEGLTRKIEQVVYEKEAISTDEPTSFMESVAVLDMPESETEDPNLIMEIKNQNKRVYESGLPPFLESMFTLETGYAESAVSDSVFAMQNSENPIINKEMEDLRANMELGREELLRKKVCTAVNSKDLASWKSLLEGVEAQGGMTPMSRQIKQLKKMRKEILSLVNVSPANTNMRLKHALKNLGDEIKPHDMQDCHSFFLNGNPAWLGKNTRMTTFQQNLFMELMGSYLLGFTALQHQRRAQKIAETVLRLLEKGPTIDKEQKLALEEAQTALWNCVQSMRQTPLDMDNPAARAMLLLEKQGDIRLHAKQVQMIQKIVDKDETHGIFQLIMGGGKSKVVLPIAAVTLADGDKLCLVVAKGALKELVASDLHKEARRTFGRRVKTLDFQRGESAETVAATLKLFRQAIENRWVVVTSSQSLHALRLSYFDALEKGSSEEELAILDSYNEILDILEFQGVQFIDEVHDVCDVRQEAHFTIGKALPVSDQHVALTNEIYRSVWKIFKRSDNIPPMEYEKKRTELIGKILESSFLTKECGFTKEEIGAVREYLVEQGDFPGCFSGSETKRDLVALLKEQLSSFLPSCATNSADVQFGRSESPLLRPYAIPYKGNNTPNERSDFADEFETLDYSVQLYLKKGISRAQMQQLVLGWREAIVSQASEEECLLEKTVMGAWFLDTFGVSIANVDTGNENDLSKILDIFNSKKSLVLKYVREHVAHSIKIFPEMISSYAQDQIDLTPRAFGVTGTTWNSNAMPRQFKTTFDPGTEGQVIQKLLYDGRPVHIVKKGTASQLMDVFEAKNDPAFKDKRAFIDVAAIFDGQPNHKVAEDLRSWFNARKDSQIKGILFFEGDRICCLTGGGELIRLKGSDTRELASRGLDPSNLFTYFDQAHTTGTDLKQMRLAGSFITVNEKTLAKDLIQGGCRMRGILDKQTTDFVATEEAAERISLRLGKKDLKSQDLIEITYVTQAERVGEDNYRALAANLRQFVRREAWKVLRAAKNDKIKQKQLMGLPAMRKVLIEKDTSSLFERFGKKDEEVDPVAYLKKVVVPELLEICSKLPESNAQALEGIGKEMNDLVDAAENERLLMKRVQAPQHSEGRQVEKEKEKEKAKEKAKEKSKETAKYQPADTLIPYLKRISWRDIEIYQESGLTGVQSSPLNEVLPVQVDSKIYDETISISKNAQHVTSGTEVELMQPFSKTLRHILVWNNGEESKYLLVDQKEADEILANLRKEGNSKNGLAIGLIGINGQIMQLGKNEASRELKKIFKESSHMKKMMQIQHFTGELGYLNRKYVKKSYLEWKNGNKGVGKVLEKIVEFRPDKRHYLQVVNN